MALVKCTECGQKVAKSAKTCPQCGVESPAKKKPGPGSNVVAAILTATIFIGLPIWGVNSCFNAIDVGTPSAEQIAAQTAQQEQRWVAERQHQPKRKQLMQRLTNEGVFRRVTIHDGDVGATTVVVDGQFYALGFDDKKTFVDVVYAYTAAEFETENVFVELRDAGTNKKVGERNLFGFKVDR